MATHRVLARDIIHKEFSPPKRGRGVDQDEVYQFLERVRETIEDMAQEQAQVDNALRERENDLRVLREREMEIQKTLMMVRGVAEDMKDQARRESDLLIGEAQLEAQKILSSAHDEHRDLLQEVIRLRALRGRLLNELRSILDAQTLLLEEFEQHASDPT